MRRLIIPAVYGITAGIISIVTGFSVADVASIMVLGHITTQDI